MGVPTSNLKTKNDNYGILSGVFLLQTQRLKMITMVFYQGFSNFQLKDYKLNYGILTWVFLLQT